VVFSRQIFKRCSRRLIIKTYTRICHLGSKTFRQNDQNSTIFRDVTFKETVMLILTAVTAINMIRIITKNCNNSPSHSTCYVYNIYLSFVCFPAVTTHCGCIFTVRWRALASSFSRFLDHTQRSALHSVGLPWTSDQSVAETST
jgi:hypothetical protein